MYSVSDAADVLGVSKQRVRAMLAKGQLQGTKVGNVWVVDEQSVAKRMNSEHPSGRPKQESRVSSSFTLPPVEEAHQLYDACKRVLTGAYARDFLNQARTDEEEHFWVRVADFFLQEKQAELIERGVF